MRALQAQLRIDFISVELTTARTMARIATIEVAAIICRTHGSVDQARHAYEVAVARRTRPGPQMTVWQILKTAPFSRLSAAERREWMKMAFYSQLVALGLQVSFNDVQIVLGEVTQLDPACLPRSRVNTGGRARAPHAR